MSRTDEYRALRDQGLTYREIAARCGVSYQAVAQVCAKSKATQFRKISTKSCAYPSLREWMNAHYVSTAELYRLMNDGDPCIGHASHVLRKRLLGITMWKKDEIDLLLKITGMTYEELFREEHHGACSTEDGVDGSGH